MSLRQAAVREAAKAPLATSDAPRRATARRADQSGTSKQSSSFFKTGPGAAALAVMVLGTGYALYSIKHDRITSPAKQ